MLSLLLLDADVIINLHRMGIWQTVIRKYEIYVASTVINVEAIFFTNKNGEDVQINLRELVAEGLIKEVNATAQEQKTIKTILKSKGVICMDPDPGELEAMAVVNENKIEDVVFCTIDGLAQEIIFHLGLGEKIIAFETVLRDLGVLRKKQKINRGWTEKKLAESKRKITLGLL